MTIFQYNIFASETASCTAAVPALVKSEQPKMAQGTGQTIILGDCLDVLGEMEAGSVDAVVTSPPYNIGVAYSTYNDRRPREEYLRWMGDVAAQIVRILADDGALFLNLGAGPDPWIAMDVANEFRRHLTLQNRIAWIKSIAIGDKTTGHFKPVNSPRYLNRTHEEICHFSKNGDVGIDRLAIGVPYQDKSNIDRWRHAQSDRRCAGNSWFIPYETVRNRAGKHHHPAGFPVELPMRCLRMHGKSSGVVLDPFVGSGSTLVAAQRLEWRGIGVEIDETYASVALARLAEMSDR